MNRLAERIAVYLTERREPYRALGAIRVELRRARSERDEAVQKAMVLTHERDAARALARDAVKACGLESTYQDILGHPMSQLAGWRRSEFCEAYRHSQREDTDD